MHAGLGQIQLCENLDRCNKQTTTSELVRSGWVCQARSGVWLAKAWIQTTLYLMVLYTTRSLSMKCPITSREVALKQRLSVGQQSKCDYGRDRMCLQNRKKMAVKGMRLCRYLLSNWSLKKTLRSNTITIIIWWYGQSHAKKVRCFGLVFSWNKIITEHKITVNPSRFRPQWAESTEPPTDFTLAAGQNRIWMKCSLTASWRTFTSCIQFRVSTTIH